MREYVLVPIGVDGGEIGEGDNLIAIQMADVCDEITMIGAPHDADPAMLQQLANGLAQRANTKRTFILLPGGIPDDWQAVHLVPRDEYDAVLQERRPGT